MGCIYFAFSGQIERACVQLTSTRPHHGRLLLSGMTQAATTRPQRKLPVNAIRCIMCLISNMQYAIAKFIMAVDSSQAPMVIFICHIRGTRHRGGAANAVQASGGGCPRFAMFKKCYGGLMGSIRTYENRTHDYLLGLDHKKRGRGLDPVLVQKTPDPASSSDPRP